MWDRTVVLQKTVRIRSCEFEFWGFTTGRGNFLISELFPFIRSKSSSCLTYNPQNSSRIQLKMWKHLLVDDKADMSLVMFVIEWNSFILYSQSIPGQKYYMFERKFLDIELINDKTRMSNTKNVRWHWGLSIAFPNFFCNSPRLTSLKFCLDWHPCCLPLDSVLYFQF